MNWELRYASDTRDMLETYISNRQHIPEHEFEFKGMIGLDYDKVVITHSLVKPVGNIHHFETSIVESPSERNGMAGGVIMLDKNYQQLYDDVYHQRLQIMIWDYNDHDDFDYPMPNDITHTDNHMELLNRAKKVIRHL